MRVFAAARVAFNVFDSSFMLNCNVLSRYVDKFKIEQQECFIRGVSARLGVEMSLGARSVLRKCKRKVKLQKWDRF